MHPKGFTLIELLVVIVIISVLAFVGITGFIGVTKSARDIQKRSDIAAIVKALEANYNPGSGYPPQLQDSWFATGKIPTPPEGGSYPVTFSQNTGFQACATLSDNSSYCKPSSQITYAIPLPAQTPVQTGVSGTKTGPFIWDTYSMGFRFTPTVNGQITKLWSYTTSGTIRTAKLYTDTGTLISSVSITGNGAWISANITPINVTAGTYYKVVVYPTSNAFNISPTVPNFPATIGNITISNGGFVTGDSALINSETGTLRGLVDITFQP